MSKKWSIILIVCAFATVMLISSCSRSASPLVLPTTTTAGASPTPLATGLNVVQTWGTETAGYVQTAAAMGTAVPASATPQPSQVPTQATATSTSILPGTGVPTNTIAPFVATNTPMPGTTPVIIVSTATPGRPATYTLKQGEFPYCIARRFNVDPNDLLSLNGLSDADVLQPGAVLKIPQTGSFPGDRALNPHPAQYTVRVNDTIYSIACHFGDVSPDAIAAANNLTLTAPLATGKILNIP
jgi:LysM repeat protein